jgi:hypothetical protein
MESTEEQRRAAWLAGCSVEEWQRRGRVAMRANAGDETVGGAVMCRVEGLNGRVVHMNGVDSGNTALMNSTTPAELATYSRKYLNDFIAGGDAADLARSASLISAALARAARR